MLQLLLSTYFLKHFRDRGQFGSPVCGLLLQWLDVLGLKHGSQLDLSVLELFNLGLGVVNVEKNAAAVLFVCVKRECLLTPFLLHLVEPFLQLKLAMGTVEYVLDRWSMTASKGNINEVRYIEQRSKSMNVRVFDVSLLRGRLRLF